MTPRRRQKRLWRWSRLLQTPNADLREAIDQLMIAQETADDPMEAAKAQQLDGSRCYWLGSANGRSMAMEMAAAGRGGDNMLAHLTPGEVVLPLGMMDDPDFERAVENRFNQLDLNPEEYVAGLGIASLNPVTGLEEFGFFKKLAKGVSRRSSKKLSALSQKWPSSSPVHGNQRRHLFLVQVLFMT